MSATPEEAAAIAAAIERFVRHTAGPGGRAPAQLDGWRREALLEGVARDPGGADPANPWINT